MDGNGLDGRRRSLARAVAITIAALMALGGVAWAAGGGLLNASFEQGSGSSLDGWTVKAYRYSGEGVRSQVYGPGQNPVPCIPGDPYGVCVVQGSDTFQSHDWHHETDQQIIVPVLDGDKMVRIGGPFSHSGISQVEDGLVLEQSFQVDPANPMIALNYNLFTYDYTGYDEVSLRVKLSAPGEKTITERLQGGFGSGVSLKSTGWRKANLNLSGYEGKTVKLEIELRGTQDELYGSWAYVDAGVAPEPAVSPTGTQLGAPATTPSGSPIQVHKYVDEATSQVFFTIPAAQALEFAGDCVPFTLSIPLNPGAGTVSNVAVRLNGEPHAASAKPGNVWTVTIPCAESGSLMVTYTLTENGVSHDFIVPLGGITLVDPQGVVYDEDVFLAQKGLGKTDAEARTAAAVSGATVTLQRNTGDGWTDVLSGDPGISPNVNPQLTVGDGIFQWEVSDGEYRVRISHPDYKPATSRSVEIPPPVLDLHVALEPRVRAPQVAPSLVPATSVKDGVASASFTFAPGSGEEQAVTGYQCSLDDAPYAGCESPLQLSDLTEQAHAFSVKAVNGKGNGPAATHTWDVKIPVLGKIKLKPAAKTVKRGKSAKITVSVSNGGIPALTGVKVCGTAPKSMVTLGPCQKIPSIGAGATVSRKIAVKVKKTAKKGKKVSLSFEVTAAGAKAHSAKAVLKVK